MQTQSTIDVSSHDVKRNGIPSHPVLQPVDEATARLLVASTVAETVKVVADSVTKTITIREFVKLIRDCGKPIFALILACGIAGAGFAFVVVGLLRLLPQ